MGGVVGERGSGRRKAEEKGGWEEQQGRGGGGAVRTGRGGRVKGGGAAMRVFARCQDSGATSRFCTDICAPLLSILVSQTMRVLYVLSEIVLDATFFVAR